MVGRNILGYSIGKRCRNILNVYNALKSKGRSFMVYNFKMAEKGYGHSSSAKDSVLKVARQMFPAGRDTVPDNGIRQSVFYLWSRTCEFVRNGESIIYNPVANCEEGPWYADIMVKDGDRWNIYNVSPNPCLAAVDINEAAYVYYLFMKAGYEIGKIYIIHVNRAYVKNGPFEPEKFLTVRDVTDKASEKKKFIEDNILEYLSVYRGGGEGEKTGGTRCIKQGKCVFFSECYLFRRLSNGRSGILDLDGLGPWADDAIAGGLFSMQEIAREKIPLTRSQKAQVEASESGVFIDEGKVSEFVMNSAEPECFYLFGRNYFPYPVPRFDGESPYELSQLNFIGLWFPLRRKNGGRWFQFHKRRRGPAYDELCELFVDSTKGAESFATYDKMEAALIIKGFMRRMSRYSERLKFILDHTLDLSWPVRNRYYIEYDSCRPSGQKNLAFYHNCYGLCRNDICSFDDSNTGRNPHFVYWEYGEAVKVNLGSFIHLYKRYREQLAKH